MRFAIVGSEDSPSSDVVARLKIINPEDTVDDVRVAEADDGHLIYCHHHEAGNITEYNHLHQLLVELNPNWVVNMLVDFDCMRAGSFETYIYDVNTTRLARFLYACAQCKIKCILPVMIEPVFHKIDSLLLLSLRQQPQIAEILNVGNTIITPISVYPMISRSWPSSSLFAIPNRVKESKTLGHEWIIVSKNEIVDYIPFHTALDAANIINEVKTRNTRRLAVAKHLPHVSLEEVVLASMQVFGIQRIEIIGVGDPIDLSLNDDRLQETSTRKYAIETLAGAIRNEFTVS